MKRVCVVLGLLLCWLAEGSHGLSFVGVDAATSLYVGSTSLAAPAGVCAPGLLDEYKQCLASNPLATKMATGACLAMTGDLIAQWFGEGEEYDRKRGVSFGLFDALYRAGQHVAFPVIVAQCQGQHLSALAGLVPTHYLATLEQTLASQLGLVPLVYYPVFFTFTALVQGLDGESGLQRAKDNFLPLMKRNLLFWVPVQFVQFSFVEEGLQIPFLSLAGLAWTFILSVMAGSANAHSHQADTHAHAGHEYCVTATEPGCEIRDEQLFPHVAMEDFQDVLHTLHLENPTDDTADTQETETQTEQRKQLEEEQQLMVK